QGEGQVGEPVRVAERERAPALVHRVQARQQHAERRRLQLAEPQIEAELGVHVLVEAAVVPQPAATVGELVVAGDDGAAVAHARRALRPGAARTQGVELVRVDEDGGRLGYADRLDGGERGV